MSGFPAFGSMYPPSVQLGPPPSPQSHSQQQQQHSQQSAQQQTIVITENPNIRKISQRSASTENTMPEGRSSQCVSFAQYRKNQRFLIKLFLNM
jgi:hypothetical protein